MAALGAEAKTGQRVTLYVKFENQVDSEDDEDVKQEVSQSEDFAICTLVAGSSDQQQLDLTFCQDERITLYSKGSCVIHLTGYHFITMDDEMDENDMEGIINDILVLKDEEWKKRILWTRKN